MAFWGLFCFVLFVHVSCFTLPSLTLHLIELTSQGRHSLASLLSICISSVIIFYPLYELRGTGGKGKGNLLKANTKPNAYYSERPKAKKGFSSRIGGRTLEFLDHPGKQPRADKKQTLQAWVWILALAGHPWASFPYSLNFPNPFAEVHECPPCHHSPLWRCVLNYQVKKAHTTEQLCCKLSMQIVNLND